MAVPVSPRTARRWKREHPETAEDRRCRWMRFISARENDAVCAFAKKHDIDVQVPAAPPSSDVTDGRPSDANGGEMCTLIGTVDRLVQLDTPTDPRQERNAFRRLKLEKARKAELALLKSELARLPRKVDPHKGFFWANYPKQAGTALVPSRIARTMPADLGTTIANQKTRKAQWQIHRECTLPPRVRPPTLV